MMIGAEITAAFKAEIASASEGYVGANPDAPFVVTWLKPETQARNNIIPNKYDLVERIFSDNW